VHRATNLCNKNCEGMVPVCTPEAVFDISALRIQTETAMKAFAVQSACELAINAVKETNKYLTDAAPWAVKGEGAAVRKAVIIRSTLEAVYAAAHFLAPFIPDAAAAVFDCLPIVHPGTAAAAASITRGCGAAAASPRRHDATFPTHDRYCCSCSRASINAAAPVAAAPVAATAAAAAMRNT